MAAKSQPAPEPTVHRFCPLHRIGFNSDLDPVCPQGAIAHIQCPDSLDFDVVAQKPVSASGALLNPRTLREIA